MMLLGNWLMGQEKYLDVMAGIFFIVGLILCYLTLHSSDFLFSIFGMGMLIISSFFFGKKEAYREYKNLHYTILEHDAKKRREKDEKLWKEAKDAVKEYEEKHS